jgi:hypothetical protein
MTTTTLTRLTRPLRDLGLATLAVVALTCAACGAEPSPAATPQASTSPSPAGPSEEPSSSATPSVEPAVALTSIDPRAPLVQSVDAGFDPSFTLRIPKRWTAVLRDRSAFQVYAGNEEFEITFDHTYREEETVAQAITRLSGTAGLVPAPMTDVVIGGRAGQGFTAGSDAAVMFTDSGFHTNLASELEVFAIPAGDGTTVTVFLTSGGNPTEGLKMLAPLARRIFKTVRWD